MDEENWESESDENINEDEQFDEEDPDVPKEIFIGTKRDLQEGETLEIVNEAYWMYHKGITEWPCLSIDFLNNYSNEQEMTFSNLNSKGVKPDYPLNLFQISGSQAD